MLIAGYDIETTGLDVGDHRIVEIYIGLWRPDGTKAFEFEQRIDPKRSIAVEAQRVHGISQTDLIGKPDFETVAPSLARIFEKATIEVAHNGLSFDGPFTEYEMKRVGAPKPERPMFDTMIEGVWATPDGKKPNLGELCFACDIEYDPSKAHAAHYDVDRMMDCFFRGVEWGFFDISQYQ